MLEKLGSADFEIETKIENKTNNSQCLSMVLRI